MNARETTFQHRGRGFESLLAGAIQLVDQWKVAVPIVSPNPCHHDLILLDRIIVARLSESIRWTIDFESSY